MTKLLAKYKKALLPNIDDWKDPHDEIRFRKDWWHMKNIEWFIFQPVAYRWTVFLMVFTSTILFSLFAVYFYNRIIYVSVIFGLIGLRMGYSTFLKIKSWGEAKTVNFYDWFFREY